MLLATCRCLTPLHSNSCHTSATSVQNKGAARLFTVADSDGVAEHQSPGSNAQLRTSGGCAPLHPRWSWLTRMMGNLKHQSARSGTRSSGPTGPLALPGQISFRVIQMQGRCSRAGVQVQVSRCGAQWQALGPSEWHGRFCAESSSGPSPPLVTALDNGRPARRRAHHQLEQDSELQGRTRSLLTKLGSRGRPRAGLRASPRWLAADSESGLSGRGRG